MQRKPITLDTIFLLTTVVAGVLAAFSTGHPFKGEGILPFAFGASMVTGGIIGAVIGWGRPWRFVGAFVGYILGHFSGAAVGYIVLANGTGIFGGAVVIVGFALVVNILSNRHARQSADHLGE